MRPPFGWINSRSVTPNPRPGGQEAIYRSGGCYSQVVVRPKSDIFFIMPLVSFAQTFSTNCWAPVLKNMISSSGSLSDFKTIGNLTQLNVNCCLGEIVVSGFGQANPFKHLTNIKSVIAKQQI